MFFEKNRAFLKYEFGCALAQMALWDKEPQLRAQSTHRWAERAGRIAPEGTTKKGGKGHDFRPRSTKCAKRTRVRTNITVRW